MKKFLIIIGVIAAILTVAVVVYAQGCCGEVENGSSSSSSDSGTSGLVKPDAQ